MKIDRSTIEGSVKIDGPTINVSKTIGEPVPLIDSVGWSELSGSNQ
jgi:hypothetical protein